MPASAPTRTMSLTRSVRRLVGPLGLTAFACVCTWTSQAPRLVHAESPAGSGVESAQSPKTWVYESRHHDPTMWWIWSEVRDYLGEDEWKSINVSWMPARARADLTRARTDL